METHLFKCKMCGGDIHAAQGQSHGTCDSCGTTSTLPKASDERIANLFNRANHFRRLNEFDKAMATYENILAEDNTLAEASWGVVLCRYGIEYVTDPTSSRRVPTCHRTQQTSILNDVDYLQTLEHADAYSTTLYEEEAKVIDGLQKEILKIVRSEEAYDIFICYKETTDGGSRTKESTLGQDMYDQLTQKGYKVFFARITLETILGKAYEPYIYAALTSSKIMLALGSSKEHFESTWVKNEWQRYLGIMKNDSTKVLIPCYINMDAYDIPEEIAQYQAQDMNKIGFMQDLLRGIDKVLTVPEEKTTGVASNQGKQLLPEVDNLLKRANLFLEDENWHQANEYFNKVLDLDSENVDAYMGLVCEIFRAKEEAVFSKTLKEIFKNFAYNGTNSRYLDVCAAILASRYSEKYAKEMYNSYDPQYDRGVPSLYDNNHYRNALKFATGARKEQILNYEKNINNEIQRIADEFIASKKAQLVKKLRKAENILPDSLYTLKSEFNELKKYINIDNELQQLDELSKKIDTEKLYRKVKENLNSRENITTEELYSIIDYKNMQQLLFDNVNSRLQRLFNSNSDTIMGSDTILESDMTLLEKYRDMSAQRQKFADAMKQVKVNDAKAAAYKKRENFAKKRDNFVNVVMSLSILSYIIYLIVAALDFSTGVFSFIFGLFLVLLISIPAAILFTISRRVRKPITKNIMRLLIVGIVVVAFSSEPADSLFDSLILLLPAIACIAATFTNTNRSY